MADAENGPRSLRTDGMSDAAVAAMAALAAQDPETAAQRLGTQIPADETAQDLFAGFRRKAAGRSRRPPLQPFSGWAGGRQEGKQSRSAFMNEYLQQPPAQSDADAATQAFRDVDFAALERRMREQRESSLYTSIGVDPGSPDGDRSVTLTGRLMTSSPPARDHSSAGARRRWEQRTAQEGQASPQSRLTPRVVQLLGLLAQSLTQNSRGRKDWDYYEQFVETVEQYGIEAAILLDNPLAPVAQRLLSVVDDAIAVEADKAARQQAADMAHGETFESAPSEPAAPVAAPTRRRQRHLELD